jgi:hypothetical protein
MKIRFMCGCDVEITDDSSEMFDDEGFVVCSIHKVRRYGWQSTGRDHSLDGLTPLQVEGWEVFGFTPIRDTFEPHPAVEDRRDNRDPEELWLEGGSWILADIRDGKVFTEDAIKAQAEMRQYQSEAARKRLDLIDRTGWEIRDMQVEGISHE